jgi:hypothetical protein
MMMEMPRLYRRRGISSTSLVLRVRAMRRDIASLRER